MVLPPSPTPREFGAALRLAREQAGVSLETISERTKIGLYLLRALEAGEFAAIPDRVFARMFLRQIVAMAKQEPQAWLPAFEAAYSRFEDASQPFRTAETTPDRRRRFWPWVVALGLAAAGMVAIVVMERHELIANGSAAPPTPDAVLPDLSPIAAPTAAPTPTPTPEDMLVLRATTRPCWIQMSVQDGDRSQRLLQPGESWETRTGGAAVDLVLGDAGAVELEYRGARQSALGRAGEVVRLHLSPGAGPDVAGQHVRD